MTAIYLEVGSKKIFAYAQKWPGWSRFGKAEEPLLQTLIDYEPRYRIIAQQAGLEFEPDKLVVVARVTGDANTDWGAPSIVTEADRQPVERVQAERNATLLRAAWTVMDNVLASSSAELRKGPRGGGRDRDKIASHVIEAERVYARKIGVRHKPFSHDDLTALTGMREEIIGVLSQPSNGEPLVPGGWSATYAIRRFTWHVTDHIWEIEDRQV